MESTSSLPAMILDCESRTLTLCPSEFLQHILYRQKEQFSDGVGYSWIDGLKAHAEEHVSYIFYFHKDK